MSTAAQHDISVLLEQSGARPAGPRRYDCSECGSRRTVSADEAKGVFYCHHAGCEFHGGLGTLRKRLGIRREWLPRAAYIRLRRERDQAHRASEVLYSQVRERRLQLSEACRALGRIEHGAHTRLRANPEDQSAWSPLAQVYRDRPRILAEMCILENASTEDLVRFLKADTQTREAALDRVIMLGGLYDSSGRFFELTA